MSGHRPSRSLDLMAQGRFLAVCDSPDCEGRLKVMAYDDEEPTHFADRVRERLNEAGWTKRRDGRDLCLECSPQKG